MNVAALGKMHVMVDAETQIRLCELLRRENRSLLQYVCQASPWMDCRDRPLFDKIKQMAETENLAVQSLEKWMESNAIALPYLGAFPIEFTNYNYVSLRKLFAPLMAAHRKNVEELVADTAAISSSEVRAVIEPIVAMSVQHLNEIGKLANG